jgi:hypothetical protein
VGNNRLGHPIRSRIIITLTTRVLTETLAHAQASHNN